jgi:hypothetical protein
MISSNSTWDRGSRKPDVSPAFSLGRAKVTYEFPNRRSQKIFSHRLGNITFRDGLGTQLSDSRNELIDEVYGQRDIGGYRYKPVSHTYIKPTLIGSDLTVLGHGAPRSGGYENCVLVGAECADGTDTQCEVGKCEVGRLSRVSGEKWRYDSLTVPGLYYFVFGTERVELRPIVRGRFSLPAGAGTIDVVYPASPSGTVYLPPNTYSAETFTRRVVRQVFSGTVDDLRLITDSVDNFARGLLGINQAEDRVEQGVKDRLLDLLYSTTDIAWHPSLLDTIENIWIQRYKITNRDFAFRCYEQLTELYSSGLQISMSGLKVARVVVDQEIGRPVYGRLPGISGSYNTDEGDTEAKWLTAGADSELSASKNLIDTFYRTFLNPATCYPLNLDWIAQHMGFIGGLWDLEWSASTKRTLIDNAHVNRLPESGPWTTDPDLDTLRRIDLSKIERVSVSGQGVVTLAYRYSSKVYDAETNLTSINTHNDLVIDVSRWRGILPDRGNLLTLLFLMWIFEVKAPSPSELSFNSSDNTFTVLSGLRANQSTAPVNTPYIVDTLKVGDDTDAEVYNYPNQLIADVSTSQDELSANTMVVRMPFYYNRDGRSWDATRSVLENYAPETSIKRVQYSYANADLLVCEDVFFEPVVE